MPYIVLPESQAGMARRRGVTRGAVSQACRPGCALHPALLPGGDVDRAHPAARKWLREPRIAETMSAAELSRATRLPLAEVQRAFTVELAPAVLPPHLVDAVAFARLSGAHVARVLTDLEHELLPAVTPDRWIDITHVAALEYLAAHPFPRGRGGDPVTGDFPPLPCAGDDIDVDHPLVRAFLARCLGRVPTDADLGVEATS